LSQREALAAAADFIRSIHANLGADVPSALEGLWFSRHQDGTLFLSAEEVEAYRELVDDLNEHFNRNQDLSRRSVELLLQDAIFQALDIPGRGKDPFPSRVEPAVAVLKAALSAKPVAYRGFIPVEGFNPTDLPVTFGHHRFVTFGKSHRRHLSGGPGTARKANRQALAKQAEKGTLWKSPCAIVTVTARDSDSALARARLATQAAIEALNFFADLVPYNYSWLRLLGDVAPGLESAAIISDESLSLPNHSVGPLGPFRLDELRRGKWLTKTFRLLSALSRNQRPNTVGEILLASFRWAGRATVELRREQSFLLFAIALESAVLPLKTNQELNFRLAVRTARLLGKTAAEREGMQKSVRDLYGLRSEIVHSGSYEVTDEDLGQLRTLTKRVLIHLLQRKNAWQEKPKTLDEWFDKLVAR
jgi:hypothetical protein